MKNGFPILFSIKVLCTYIEYTSSQSIFYIFNCCLEHFKKKQLETPKMCSKKHAFETNSQENCFLSKNCQTCLLSSVFKNSLLIGPKVLLFSFFIFLFLFFILIFSPTSIILLLFPSLNPKRLKP